ncbi:hypothetical protein [Alicyclobacillus macrosporangiidus]|uniref:hypothetical protein n=1 Tax=Alicyclobacillus macrosporangiidus TaxID=392015 RepID=UPI000A861D84|nr:hypothetical protein [Alicyclobacillus macrosporangiidus]
MPRHAGAPVTGPVLPPSGHGTGVPPAREAASVRGPGAATEGSRQREIGAARGSQAVRTHQTAPSSAADGVGLAQVARLEQSLPAILMERSSWLHTEWAWRRLLFETALAGHTAGQSEGHQTSQVEVAQFGIERLWAVLAELIASAGPEGEVVRWPGTGPGTVPVPGTMPVPGRVPVAAAVPEPGTVPAPGALPGASMTQPGIVTVSDAIPGAATAPEPGMVSVPGMVTGARTAPGQGSGTAPGFGHEVTAGVTDFAHWRREEVSAAPERVRNWVYLQRMMGAVRSPDGSIHGAGLFWLPSPTPGQGTMTAVRWEGRRQSRSGPGGITVHRIRLGLRLAQAQVNVELVCARPSLSVRVRAPERMQPALAAAAEPLAEALAESGWRLNSWRVLDVEEERDGEEASGGASV